MVQRLKILRGVEQRGSVMPSLPTGHRRSIVLTATSLRQAQRLSDRWGLNGGAIVEGSSAFTRESAANFTGRHRNYCRTLIEILSQTSES